MRHIKPLGILRPVWGRDHPHPNQFGPFFALTGVFVRDPLLLFWSTSVRREIFFFCNKGHFTLSKEHNFLQVHRGRVFQATFKRTKAIVKAKSDPRFRGNCTNTFLLTIIHGQFLPEKVQKTVSKRNGTFLFYHIQKASCLKIEAKIYQKMGSQIFAQ